MANFNQIILVGNLTRAGEIRLTKNERAVLNGGIAVNEKWKDANGEKKERVCFVDFTIWGEAAETFQKYTRKGSCVMLSGRLTMDEYEKDDQKRVKHFVTVDSFQFLDKAPAKGDGAKKRSNTDETDDVPF